MTLSQLEVAAAFHLPLALAATRARLQVHHFRGGQPYWAVEVSDLIKSAIQIQSSHPNGDGPKEKVEVWGLTGWYLFQFMKLLRFMSDEVTFHVVWHPSGTQATYNVIREGIGARGGHMFLILVGGLARCLAEWVFTVSDYCNCAWPILRKDPGCTVVIVTNQGVSQG